MVRKGADKMAKNDQKSWSQPGFEPGSFQKEKKVRIFCLKLYHWATGACTEESTESFARIKKNQKSITDTCSLLK